jgi:hypothetical protein
MLTSRKALYFFALAALASLGVAMTRGYILDDAFITFRYGKHLAELGHATWNPPSSGPSRQGFTSIVWMLLSAAWTAAFANGDAVFACARLTSFGALLAIAYLLARRLAELHVPVARALVFGALVLGSWAHGLHVNSGMETVPFAAVMLGVLVARASSRSFLSYLLVALAALVRPEAAACGLALVAVDLQARRTRDAARGAALLAFVALGAVLLLHSAYAQLPTPLVLKVGTPRPKLTALASMVVFTLLYALVPTVACLRAARADPVARLALVLVLALLLPVSFVRPVMNVEGRYEWAALLLLAYGGASVLRARVAIERAGLVVAAVGAITLAWTSARSAELAAGMSHDLQDGKWVGSALASARLPGTLAVWDAGVVPYYADMQTKDMLGLADGERSEDALGDLCDKDIAAVVEWWAVSDDFEAALTSCGFQRRVPRRYVCEGAPQGLSIFVRDQAVLAYLPSDGGEAACPGFQRSLLGRTFAVDTEIGAIERLARAARSSWGPR